MPTHAERRIVAYSPEQMYDLVADVERYPEFLPWCLRVRPSHSSKNVVEAEVEVGFKALREKFTSRNTLVPKTRIEVEYLNGPFRHLNNHWVFHPHAKGCEIEFYIDFEMKSNLLKLVIGPVFNEAVKIMVRAFEKRAKKVYG
jgi:coenzyme Q-binding protein COQ10